MKNHFCSLKRDLTDTLVINNNKMLSPTNFKPITNSYSAIKNSSALKSNFKSDMMTVLLLSKNLKIKIYRTIILSVVLYGCETWSLTLREEHCLRVFENRVLRRIFGP